MSDKQKISSGTVRQIMPSVAGRQKTPPLSGSIKIPKSALDQKLAEAAAIKKRAYEMLADLEKRAKGDAERPSTQRPGGWRHDPLGWFSKK